MILEYIVTGNGMKLLDDTTSQVFLVPSVVLMEQAAAGVVWELVACFDKSKEFAVICGRGNNAGDGIAIARLLNQAGYRCMVYYAFGTDEAGSELFELQKNIYARYGFKVVSDIECVCKSDVIIDALFGTGLKRAIEGSLADVISAVNKANAYRVAVDVPSGVDSDKGHVMGCTFKADFTYTFSYKKTGLLLWPGCDYCGLVKVVPIGIDDHSFCGNLPSVRALDESDLNKLDNRPAHSNKGTFGKLLVIAGSRNMAGAAVLSAKAAYKSGAGLVKIITPECNRSIIQCALPEALLCTDIASAKALETELEWADAVVIGPGLSKSDNAKMLVETVLKTAEIPLVIDADALNIISDNMTLLNEHKMPVIVTPHLGEMSRLMKKSIADIQEDIIGVAGEFASLYNVTCVLKDFRTIIAAADGEKFINLSGNCGMATAGSGDVLSGIVGGLLVQWRDTKKAAAYGAFIHGLAGDMVFDNTGSYGMIASDIIDGLDKVWIKVEKNGN